MADAVGVAEHGDLGVVLDVAHQLVGAARDDQVDVAVEGEQLGDDVAGGDELDGAVGDPCPRQSVRDDPRNGDERLGRLLAALEDGGVARLDGQRGDVGDDLGTGLEDDEQHTDGAGDALEIEAVVEAGSEGDLADGVLEVPDVEDALEHVLPLALLAQVETGHQAGAQLAVGGGGTGQLEIAGVGGKDVIPGRRQSGVDRREGFVAGVRREGREYVRCRLGRPGRIRGACVGKRHDVRV